MTNSAVVCEHDWSMQDESFDHEFGTEVVHYFECELCGVTKPLEPGDYEDPFWEMEL